MAHLSSALRESTTPACSVPVRGSRKIAFVGNSDEVAVRLAVTHDASANVGVSKPVHRWHEAQWRGLKVLSVSGTALAAGVSQCFWRQTPLASAIPLTKSMPLGKRPSGGFRAEKFASAMLKLIAWSGEQCRTTTAAQQAWSGDQCRTADASRAGGHWRALDHSCQS